MIEDKKKQPPQQQRKTNNKPGSFYNVARLHTAVWEMRIQDRTKKKRNGENQAYTDLGCRSVDV